MMVSKPNKKFPQNYSPFSLLSSLSKVPETIIVARLTTKTENRNIISEEQFEFKNSLSTTLQILGRVEHVTERLNQVTGVLLLNIAKSSAEYGMTD